MSDAPVPVGCQCSCQHRGAPEGQWTKPADAPVAYLVKARNGAGEPMKVCTVCLHDDDEIVSILASFEMDPTRYFEYDPFGTITLSQRMHDRQDFQRIFGD